MILVENELYEYDSGDLRGKEIPVILKPCPFCGEEDKLSVQWYTPESRKLGRRFQIHCRYCGAYGPAERTISEAADAWGGVSKA